MRTRVYHRMLRLFFLLGVAASIGIHLTSAQWVQQTSDTPENLVDVVVLDSMKALTIGDRNGILRTTDAGSTWINESAAISAVYRWNSLSFFGPSNGTVVGAHRIVTTTDGGITWKLLTLPSTQKCLSVLHLHIGTANIYVGADSGWMYHTLDSGKTWTSEKISTGPIRALFARYGIDLMDLPVYALTPYSLCSKMEFPSTPWFETILPQFQGLGSEAIDGEFCKFTGLGFIVGVLGDARSLPAITRLSPPDTTWQVIPLNSPRDGELRGISAPSSNVIYVCGSSGMVFKTTDGGNTWTSLDVPTTRNLNALYFWNETHGFAVGDSGTILFTANGGLTAVSDKGNRPPASFALSQNYPNPFNPTTNFRFTIAELRFVELKVYDILGREVASLANEMRPAGNYTIQWNATGFPSGVYFYRLIAGDWRQVGNFVETKKLLLLK